LKDDGLVVIGVNLLRDERAFNRDIKDVRQFATLYGVGYPMALDADGTVSQEYLVSNIPVSYVIDADGTARFVRIGELTTANVRAMVDALKQEAAASVSAQ
jgi:alkyl hydroperoxide reductase subunit AhpC